MRRLRSQVVIVTLAVVVAACADDASSTTITPPEVVPSTTVPSGQIIGADGGSVVSDDGNLRLEIPAGALSTEVAIEIVEVDADSVGVDASLLAGPVYDLRPAGTRFAVPVTIVRKVDASQLGLDDDEVPLFFVLHRHDGVWSPLTTRSRRTDGTIEVTAVASSFSEVVAVAYVDAFGQLMIVTMQPKAFTRLVDGTADLGVILSSGGPPLDLHGDLAFTWSADGAVAVAPIPESIGGRAIATCLAEGAGTYSLGLKGSEALPPGLLAWFVLAFDPLVAFEAWPSSFETTVTGEALCRPKPTPVPADVIGTYDAAATLFTPVADGPPGTEYPADLILRIGEGAGGLVIEIEQLPQGQLQEGWVRLSEAIFYAAVGSGTGYTEATMGWLTPSDTGLEILALNWGGPPGLDAEFWEAIEDFANGDPSTWPVTVDPAGQRGALEQLARDLGLTEGTSWLNTVSGTAQAQVP